MQKNADYYYSKEQIMKILKLNTPIVKSFFDEAKDIILIKSSSVELAKYNNGKTSYDATAQKDYDLVLCYLTENPGWHKLYKVMSKLNCCCVPSFKSVSRKLQNSNVKYKKNGNTVWIKK